MVDIGKELQTAFDDGYNEPTFVYGATVMFNRENNGGTIWLDLKIHHAGLEKIVNIFLSTASWTDEGIVTDSHTEYFIDLQDAPTPT